MPEAFKFTGWFLGCCFLLVIGVCSSFCGVLLGRCWLLLESRDPTLAQIKTRNPYALIGEKSFGQTGYAVAMLTLVIQLFGGAVVQLLLSAEMIKTLLQPLIQHHVHLTFCEWIVISGLILLPLSFCGSPVDFSPIALFAMGSTSLAAVLILVACFTNPAQAVPEASPSFNVSPLTVLLGIGSVCFSFSGAACMPTIHNDMKRKESFGFAVVLAYAVLILIYLPVSVVGYYQFGSETQSNIVRNLSPSLLTTGIQGLIAAHVLCAYLILLNPVNLNLENFLRIQHSFSWIRCLSRTGMTCLAVFVALSVPKFGKVLNLVGASAVVFQSFILPSFFYLRLTDSSAVARQTRLLLLVIMATALLLGVASSASALFDLVDPKAFTLPCYISSCDLETQ